MQKQLQKLARLQEIDDQLAALERSKGDYPERIQELKAQLTEQAGALKEAQEKQDELEKERRHLERAVQEGKDTLAKLQKRLGGVKTNKEWDAMQKEMDAAKEGIGERETRLLEVMEALEELNQTEDSGSDEAGEFRTQAEAEIKDLKGKLGSVDSKMSRIRSERDSLSTQIDDRLKRVYNRVKQGKQGTAVVPVVREACGGCYSRIPPQTLVEIRRAERPMTCENCGRIIVWMDESSDA